MKLLIILTFCLGFVVCRDTLTFILPAETGPAPVPTSYQPVPAVIPPSDEIPGVFKVWFVHLGLCSYTVV